MKDAHNLSEEQIFAEALRQLTPEAREAYLKQACGSDEPLRRRIEALLHAHDDAGKFLDQPPAAASAGTLLITTAMLPVAEKPGDRIGHYKLLQQIGEGGCGVVYMAEQQEPVRRRVALKVIKPGMDTRQVLARFEAERQALALMDHPNIAKVLDAGATDTGRPFFVMELVRGVKITDYCDDPQNKLSTDQRLDLFIQVCRAIQHAHQKGIIHRDIKPSNILVTLQADGTPAPKIIDFGIAKATAGQTLTDKTLFTAFEQFMGTPAYMAPEQAQMTAIDIDTRSDIYSLGVLLYELLTGKTPFDSKRLMEAGLDEIRRIISEEEPPRPSTRLSTLNADERTTVAKRRQSEPPKLIHLVRGDLDWIVMKCLEKDRGRRYETANGLARDIERHLDNEPIVARPPSNLYRFQKLVRRNKLAFAAASSMVLALVVGLAVSTWALLQEQQARTKEEQARREAVNQAERARRSEAVEVVQRQRTEQLLEETKLQRAEDLFKADNSSDALAILAAILRGNPSNRVAACRLVSALTYRNFALPLAEPLNHADYVYQGRYSPDGQLVVTASKDKTAFVWDAQTGRKVLGPLDHDGEVRTAEFSPDGQRILTASRDKMARVWDAKTGKVIVTLPHDAVVLSAHFGPDGELAVTAGGDGSAAVWNTRSGVRLATLGRRKGRTSDAKFSLDGKLVVAASWDGTARVWKALTGEPVSPPLDVPGFQIFTADLSPDGTRVATGSEDFKARVWDTRTGAVLCSLEHSNWVYFVRFSPDGQRVATASWDGTARLWDVQTGRPLIPPLRHNGIVYSAQFSADGRHIVTASEDKTARIWDAETGRMLMEPLRHNSEVYYAEFGPGGRTVATASKDNTARIWDVSLGKALSLELGHDARVSFACFTSDGKKVISTQKDYTAWVWDAQGGVALHRKLRDPSLPALDVLAPGAQRTIACSPNDRRLVVGDQSGNGRIYDVLSGQAMGSPLVHRGRITQVEFSHDGRRILTASYDGSARLWNAETGELATPPLKHEGRVYSADFSPDDQKIVTGSGDGARLWNAQGQILLTNVLHKGLVCFVKFSPDGKRVVSTSWDNTGRIWDAATGQPLCEPLKHSSIVDCADFTPDSSRVLTCSWDGTARVWDVRTGKPLTPAMQHAAAIFFGQFSPDGSKVVTASADHTARVWDSETGHPITEPLQHDGDVCSACFSPDGMWVVTASADKTARIWEVPSVPTPVPSWLPELAEALIAQRVNHRGLFEPVAVEQVLRIKRLIEAMPADDYSRHWAKWFFADRSKRTISPFSKITVPEYIETRIKENTVGSLALGLCTVGAAANLPAALRK
jgi:WD40 repeat protein/serine/threonine protein kinase